MFDESIARVASAFLKVDGVLYAPAGELMELFAVYSSVMLGCMLIFLLGIGVFVALVAEPVGQVISWMIRKLASSFSK